MDLTGYFVLPGLVNAHDHLEFNLFPRLGRGPYTSAEEWAEDLHRCEGATIRAHSAVPKMVRLWWGGVKNLLCGVTTVGHHNPYDEQVFEPAFPVRVLRRFGWAHSLTFGKQITAAFQRTPADAPFILHLGEGVDQGSRREIFLLDQLGALDSRTVIVHGVGLDSAGRDLLDQHGAALVWCPTSNLFTLGRTLNLSEVSRIRRLALGSDSALTAQGDLLDELRTVGRDLGGSPGQLYSLVTDRAADVLRLHNGEGTLREGAKADLVVIEWRGEPPAESLARTTFRDIHAVIVGGRLHLVSPQLADRWASTALEGLESLDVEGTERWVRAPVEALLTATRPYLGEPIRLAGRQVST